MVDVYLDMDGTIADLYNFPKWLEYIEQERENLFKRLRPMIRREQLHEMFPSTEYKITILSMTPMGASVEYCAKVIEEKNEWLDRHFPEITSRIYLPYSLDKNLKNSENAILIDDNAHIRHNWKGIAINPMKIW